MHSMLQTLVGYYYFAVTALPFPSRPFKFLFAVSPLAAMDYEDYENNTHFQVDGALMKPVLDCIVETCHTDDARHWQLLERYLCGFP